VTDDWRERLSVLQLRANHHGAIAPLNIWTMTVAPPEDDRALSDLRAAAELSRRREAGLDE
jgi:hypothetical protein